MLEHVKKIKTGALAGKTRVMVARSSLGGGLLESVEEDVELERGSSSVVNVSASPSAGSHAVMDASKLAGVPNLPSLTGTKKRPEVKEKGSYYNIYVKLYHRW